MKFLTAYYLPSENVSRHVGGNAYVGMKFRDLVISLVERGWGIGQPPIVITPYMDWMKDCKTVAPVTEKVTYNKAAATPEEVASYFAKNYHPNQQRGAIVDGNRRFVALCAANIIRQKLGMEPILEVDAKVDEEIKTRLDYEAANLRYNLAKNTGGKDIDWNAMIPVAIDMVATGWSMAEVERGMGILHGTGQKAFWIAKGACKWPDLNIKADVLSGKRKIVSVSQKLVQKGVEAYEKPDAFLEALAGQKPAKSPAEKMDKVANLGQNSDVVIIRLVCNAIADGQMNTLLGICREPATLAELNAIVAKLLVAEQYADNRTDKGDEEVANK